jgi:hypothetical protein
MTEDAAPEIKALAKHHAEEWGEQVFDFIENQIDQLESESDSANLIERWRKIAEQVRRDRGERIKPTRPTKPRAKFSPTTEETLEQLARIACSLHGMKADGPLILSLGDKVRYDGIAWQSPDMMAKAKAAFDILLPDVLTKQK